MPPTPPPPDTQSIYPCPQCGTGVRFRTDPTSERKSCPHCGYVLPSQVAHFKLQQIIGTGGMGAVYRGLDISLERQVAVKVMREEFARNPQFVESFLREARAAAALNHPNVAQIYSFGEQNSRYYLVMELLTNGSLDDRIEKEHRLPEVEVLDVGIQVASGLRAAFERGLIHRDIKPGNILFGQDHCAKVVDFGLARWEDKGQQQQQQQEEGIWGTPYYIAPEKVAGEPEDFRSDIYSLGGTLFHALAGRAPFEAGTSTEVVLKHLHSPAVSLRAFAPDSTPQTAEVIGRMLKREPADRPQSYDELLNDLAYAKRFALEKKPMEKVQVESDVSTGKLVTTLIIMVVCLAASIWLWFNRHKFLPENEETPVASTNVVSHVPTNTQPAQAVVATQPPVQKPVEPPPPPPPPDYKVLIDQAHEDAEQGNWTAALGALTNISRTIPAEDPLQGWVRVGIARIKLLMGHHTEGVALLDTFVGTATAESLSSPVPVEKHPLLLGLILLGKISGDEVDKKVSELPDWMKAAAHYDAAIAAIKNDHLAEGAAHSRTYLKLSENIREPRWVLMNRTRARDFSNEYEEFKVFQKEIDELQAKGNIPEMDRKIKDHHGKWRSAPILAIVTKLTESTRQNLAVHQKEQEEKLKAERAVALESDAKVLEPMRARRVAFMNAYQFSQLYDAWKFLEPSIKSEENKKLVKYQIAVAQNLADFKATLIKDIIQAPYDQDKIVKRSNIKVEGRLQSANDAKLIFKVQYGEVPCAWGDLSPTMIGKLGDHYWVHTDRANASELTRRALSLAVFAREFALRDEVVRSYLTFIEKTGLNMKESVDQLFPQPPVKF